MNQFPKNNQETLLCIKKYPLIIDFLLTITDLSDTRCLMQNKIFWIWTRYDGVLCFDVAGNDKILLCSFNQSQLTYLFENKNKLKELINFI